MTLYLYLWVALGSAIGGCLRFALGRTLVTSDAGLPWSTILINVLGSFVIGAFGTLTAAGSRYEAPEHLRIFVMIGICGGFTTFSAFTLENFEMLRAGSWGRALANVLLSVTLSLVAVAAGYLAAHPTGRWAAVAQTNEERFTG